MKSIKALILFVCLAGLPLSVFAFGGGLGFSRVQFLLADDNRDGFIEKSDVKSGYGLGVFEYFDVVDQNHDGRITLSEFEGYLYLPMCALKKNCHS
jgi:hypothetical protein